MHREDLDRWGMLDPFREHLRLRGLAVKMDSKLLEPHFPLLHLGCQVTMRSRLPRALPAPQPPPLVQEMPEMGPHGGRDVADRGGTDQFAPLHPFTATFELRKQVGDPVTGHFYGRPCPPAGPVRESDKHPERDDKFLFEGNRKFPFQFYDRRGKETVPSFPGSQVTVRPQRHLRLSLP